MRRREQIVSLRPFQCLWQAVRLRMDRLDNDGQVLMTRNAVQAVSDVEEEAHAHDADVCTYLRPC